MAQLPKAEKVEQDRFLWFIRVLDKKAPSKKLGPAEWKSSVWISFRDQKWMTKNVVLSVNLILASQPSVLGSILGIPKKFSLEVSEIYWRQWLEQWTDARKRQKSRRGGQKWSQSHFRVEEEEEAKLQKNRFLRFPWNFLSFFKVWFISCLPLTSPFKSFSCVWTFEMNRKVKRFFV